MVFAGIYPIDADDYEELRNSLEKLQLNDASLTYVPESSAALGFGFRCGFLGLLHLEIIQERLEREFNLEIIATSPSVPHEIVLRGEDVQMIHSPIFMPDPSSIKEIREPWAKVEVLTPTDYMGAVLDLITRRRGVIGEISQPSENRAVVSAEMPMANLITDFHDGIKSATRGFASMSFDFIGFRAGDLVKMDILLAGEISPSLSQIVHRSETHSRGSDICRTIKENLPRRQFAVAIQAAIGGKIVARETVSAVRKDVTAKLYGGDVTRKNKLLKKQKKGKKKMKEMGTGRVSVPKEIFLKILRRGE